MPASKVEDVALMAKTQVKVTPKATVAPKALDNRAEVLAAYLEEKNSPLQYHAQDLVEAADNNNIDWKLVPAISGVESTFGKAIPGGTGDYSSYNGWGWGVYGNQAIYFKSWKDGINTVAQGLKTRYIDRGLKSPAEMNRVYASSPTWGVRVEYFLNDLHNYAQEYNAKKPAQLVSHTNIEGKVVETSAKLK